MSEVQPERINREGVNSLSRYKRRFAQESRSFRVHLSKRPRIQPRLAVSNIHDSSSTCHCPHTSILQDLKNQYSGLNAELCGIKTRLTELQQVCVSIHSMLLSAQPNILQTTAIASDAGVPAASQPIPSFGCSVPASTAASPTSVTMLPPKFTPVNMQIGSSDSTVRPVSISNEIRTESQSVDSSHQVFNNAHDDLTPIVSQESLKPESPRSGAACVASPSDSFYPRTSHSTRRCSVRNKQRRQSTGSMTSSNANSNRSFNGSCSPNGGSDDARKPSTSNDKETEKRIADILHAARIAMSEEQREKTQHASLENSKNNATEFNSLDVKPESEPFSELPTTTSVTQLTNNVSSVNPVALPLVVPPLGVTAPSEDLPELLQFILSQSSSPLSVKVPATSNLTSPSNNPVWSSTASDNPVSFQPPVTLLKGSNFTTSILDSTGLGVAQGNPLDQTLVISSQTDTPDLQSVHNFPPANVTEMSGDIEVPSSISDTSISSNTADFLSRVDHTFTTTVSRGTDPGTIRAETVTSPEEKSILRNDRLELSSCVDQTNHTASTTLFQRPTGDEVVQMAKTLDNLDTDVLRAQVKDVLKTNSVSQRLFGEVILGMCQASVSDLLSKSRSWSQLTEKARLPYVRMYMWLNHPDRMDPLREATVSGNNAPKPTIRSQSQSVDTDLSVCSQVSRLTKVVRDSGEQEHLNLSESPQDHAKLKSKSPVSPDATACCNRSVLDSGHQSLVDIAKAATLAMRRGNNFGPNSHTRVRGQIDRSLNNSGTSTKIEPTGNLSGLPNGSDVKKESGVRDFSLKQLFGRNRVVFSPTQKQTLINEFARQPYPSSSSLRSLARELNLPYKPVVNWFHNRRMRSRQRFLNTGATHDKTMVNVFQKREFNRTSLKASNQACSASIETQSSRRKRTDPTRLLTETIDSLLNSIDTDLIYTV